MSSGDDFPGLTEPMMGALLRQAYEATHGVLFGRLHAAGFSDVRYVHFALFKFPGPHGSSPTELADRVGMSKQTLNPILNELEAFGYLTRQRDHGDNRSRILVLTDRGRAFSAEIKSILVEIEAHLERRLGARQFSTFRSTVSRIPELLNEPTET